ncbi:hypothetical protein R1sor_000291 [Riccia sorocarpa]|uniref:Uncharacterized protein n=1 Tax=Riccia sorocarpa TaxID=122646 RepID=A0ABD3GWN8_9MARC
MDDKRRSVLEDRLIQQWKEIEELEADEGSNVDDDRFKVTKEQWFLEAFAFLKDLPEESHCWCGHREIMLPLLEPFYLYYEETSSNSSLKVLWRRLCKELKSCTSCVVKHHKAQEYYITEFMEDVVKPLLDILRALDEERVAGQMKDLLRKFEANSLDPNEDSAGVICVVFEVLMFPSLQEDAEISELMKPFLLHVEETHDLSLASGQRYPGVYSLLCHADQGVRRIALKLAHSLPTFRNEQELEAVQPFLQRCLRCLEFDAFDSNTESTEKSGPPSLKGTGRPRVGFTKEALWIGLTTLLGILEAPAFLKGVLERYPVFVSIVLNHVSEATSVFWNALRCLKLLLEVLGYKLWLGTTFSPGVMRNTLLSQCFHSHEERMHVHIFDLFQPFLQSLEALQDGEYENQRRRLLYFLLQQVPCSNNFKPLMTKKARQVAFSIVARGYTMDPPLPPVECVHFWGPPLVATLKDVSLIKSVRQSAVDLIQSILVADAAALASVTIQQLSSQNVRKYTLDVGDDDFDSVFEDESPTGEGEMVAGVKYSVSFSSVTRSVEACEDWSCVPLLWMEALSETVPASVPGSFTKAVMWGLSRLSVIDTEGTSGQNNVLVSGDGVACSDAILTAFKWVKPKGYDDGAAGEGCLNAVKAKAHVKEMISILKRLAEKFITRVGENGVERLEGWLWEPRMAEPVIMLLLDANSVFRDFVKELLRCTVNATSLESLLEFLCSSEGSAAAVSRGLHYATKLFLRWPLTQCSRGLQQLFFHVWKLLVLGETPKKEKLTSLSQISQDGGFLTQPSLPGMVSSTESTPPAGKIQKDDEVWRRLCRVMASHMWPLLEKTLFEGRQCVDGAGQLMTFTRMLQLLPLVCRHLDPAHKKKIFTVPRTKQCSTLEGSTELTWFQALVRWGDLASAIIQRWWKEAIVSILEDLKETELVSTSAVADIIVEFRKPGFTLTEEFKLQLHNLLQSLSTSLESQEFVDTLPPRPPKTHYAEAEAEAELSKPLGLLKLQPEGFREIVDLTEDEDNYGSSSYQALSELTLSSGTSTITSIESPSPSSTAGSSNKEGEPLFKRPSVRQRPSSTLDQFLHKARIDQVFGQANKPAGATAGKSTAFKPPGYKKYNAKPQKPAGKLSAIRAEHRSDLEQRAVVEDTVRMQVRERVEKEERAKRLAASEAAAGNGKQELKLPTPPVEKLPAKIPAKMPEAKILRELVTEADPLDQALETARKGAGLKDHLSKNPRRKLVRLELPGEGGKGGTVVKTPEFVIKPRVVPRMDDWLKRILSLNYLSLVGVSDDDDPVNFGERLEKVPLMFRSSDHYMETFRPLVMEEFKAQLQRAHGELNLSDNSTVGVLRLMSLERVDDFQLGRFMSEAGSDAAPRACAENELVLLSRQPMSVGQQTCHLLAKVETRERESKSRATILLMKIFIQVTDPRLSKAKRLLVDRSKWHLTRVMNMSPQLRECQALSGFASLPLLPILISPEFASKTAECAKSADLQTLPEKLQEKLTGEHNESQIRAIAFAIGTKESKVNGHQLTLVQGPPGTGKTKTIMAIISALLAVKSPRRNQRGGKENSHLPSGLNPSVKMSAAARNAFAISRSWQDAALAKQMMKDDQSGHGDGLKQRILVCAQSNAAVDEIVARILKNGLYGAKGSFFKPSVVRVGAVKSVHPNSMPVFIDTLVNQRLGLDKEAEPDDIDEAARAKLMESKAKLEEIIEFIQVLEALQNRAKGFEDNEKTGQKPVNLESDVASKAAKIVSEGASAITGKLNLLYKQRREISAELANAQKEERKAWEENQNKRKAIRKEIIKQADVVVTTLSGCGGDIYTVCMESIVGAKKNKGVPSEECFFDAVVIDEAAQALEPATLIPFQLLSQINARCVMVGDPKQLPATVLSQTVGKMAYDRSMFERLQRAGYPVTMLSTQYRMHPEIRQFPSAHFYDNLITDGPGLKATRKAIFHREAYLGPFVFFDVTDGEEGGRDDSASQSISNRAEVDVVLQLYLTLKKRYSAELWEGRVGVITPYKQQLRALQEQFVRAVGTKAAADVEFNTVDGFQGREVDIIILSTVRARSSSSSKSGGIGFVADVRRMNVALTRARFSCWVVGHAATLQSNRSWNALLENASKRRVIYPLQKPYATFFEKKGAPPLLTPADSDEVAHRALDVGISPRNATEDDKNRRSVDERRRQDWKQRRPQDERRALEESNLRDDGGQHSVKLTDQAGKSIVEHEEPLVSGTHGNSLREFRQDNQASAEVPKPWKAEKEARVERKETPNRLEDRGREERKKRLVRIDGEKVRKRSEERSDRHNGPLGDRPSKKVANSDERREEVSRNLVPKQEATKMGEKSQERIQRDRRYSEGYNTARVPVDGQRKRSGSRTSEQDDYRATSTSDQRRSSGGQASVEERTRERLRQDGNSAERSRSSSVTRPEAVVDRRRNGSEAIISVQDRNRRSSVDADSDRRKPNSMSSTGTEKRVENGSLSRSSVNSSAGHPRMNSMNDTRNGRISSSSATATKRNEERQDPQSRRTSREDMLAARKRQREEASGILSAGLLPPEKRPVKSAREGRPLPSRPELTTSERRTGQSSREHSSGPTVSTSQEMAYEWEQFQKALQASKAEPTSNGVHGDVTPRASSASAAKRMSSSSAEKHPQGEASSSALDSILSNLYSVTRLLHEERLFTRYNQFVIHFDLQYLKFWLPGK